MPDGLDPNHEPPIQPDDTNPSQAMRPVDLSSEPPISPDDTNPSRAMQAVDLSSEPPVAADDTNPSQVMRPVDLSSEPPFSPDDTNPSRAMQAVDLSSEPPVAAHDTNPSIAMRPAELRSLNYDESLAGWRRVMGVLSLLLAVLLTVGAIVITFMPQDTPPIVEETPIETVDEAALEPTLTESPTETAIPPTAIPDDAASAQTTALLPTISADQAAALLAEPVINTRSDDTIRVVRNPYEPFTLIPDRPRSEVIDYVIEQGDTINAIAEKFGISPESVVWANNRDIVGILNPGDTINIVPENGVYVTHVGTSTIQDYANRYFVSDPYIIIDSEYNPDLRGLTPDTVPPSGTQIMIPGGEAEQINWNPTVVREGGDGGGSGGNFITFAPGDPGSCGRVANPGGGAFWSNPLGNYTWMRGFTSFHTGVDLAASEGTPVQAANSGRVVFAGWNNWGYGYTVVLAHGPFTTLYGHLSSIYVGCGQDVSAGTTIAGTGNTGNSSGPHLHFEIRYNDQPQDPTISIGF